MPKRLRVSIVIPAYNEERHLAACLDAIARQTSPVFEVVVVDNNSTDQTAAIAKQYSFVRLVREKRQGRVFARNAGFDAARGDIIGRIDADTELPKHWVEHIQAFFADDRHLEAAWGGGPHFYNVRFPRLASWGYELLAFRFNRLLLGSWMLWGSNTALRREQWLTIRRDVHLRNDIHEDLDLSIHLTEAGYRTFYDRSMPVNAQLRHVNANRGDLWEYLQWWPRTMRLHRKQLWFLAWFFGAFLLYPVTYLLVIAEQLARLFGRTPNVE